MFDMLYIKLIFVACLTLLLQNKYIYLSGGRHITLLAASR